MKPFWNKLVAVALGMLGFASCAEIANIDDDPSKEDICMYGSPSATYKVLGTVSDESGSPVEGIRVAIESKYGSYSQYDTLYTDSSGKYLFNRGERGLWPDKVVVVFEDIDGEENGGEFESAEATPELKKVKEGDGSWYMGMFEAQADVTLKKK